MDEEIEGLLDDIDETLDYAATRYGQKKYPTVQDVIMDAMQRAGIERDDHLFCLLCHEVMDRVKTKKRR